MKRTLTILICLSMCFIAFAQNEWIKTDSGPRIWTDDSLSHFFNSATYFWTGQTIEGVAHGKGIYSVKNKEGYLIAPHEATAYYGVIGTDEISSNVCDSFVYSYIDSDGQKNGFSVSLVNGRLIFGSYSEGESYDSVAIYSHINDTTDILNYYGECECDIPEGLGTSYYQNGHVQYKGEWSDGMYDGFGCLYYQNGALAYTGSFKKGLFTDIGTAYDRSGVKLYDGEWKQGIAVNGQCMGQKELLIYDDIIVSAGVSPVMIDNDSVEQLSINYRPEKRIYLLDVTGSMEGRGNVPSPNIFSEVKSKLAKTIFETKDVNTEIVIIPFSDQCFEPIIGTINEKDSIILAINNLETKRGDTNIAGAWNKCVSEIDSTKTNYLFILTDGLHNSGPSKEILYDNLKKWGKTSFGHYYFAYYVMLTSNARDEEIRQIADTTNQMWKIESMDVNASFISTALSIRRNINAKKTVRIDFTSNNENVFSQDIPLNITLEDNPFYSAKIDSHFKDKYILLEVNELQDKMSIPAEVSLSLKIEYDKEAYPLVFFTPDVIQLDIVNCGVKTMAITDKNGYSNGVRFDDVKFKEPFLSILKNRPKILLESLSVPPFSWFVPDTICFEKEISVMANDDCIRSGSSINLHFVDKQLNTIPGTIMVDNVAVNNGIIPLLPKNNINYLTIRYIPESYFKPFDFEDYQIVVSLDGVDVLNGKDVQTNEFSLGQNAGKYQIVINWELWLLWLLSLLLIIATPVFLVNRLIKGLSRIFNKRDNSI